MSAPNTLRADEWVGIVLGWSVEWVFKNSVSLRVACRWDLCVGCDVGDVWPVLLHLLHCDCIGWNDWIDDVFQMAFSSETAGAIVCLFDCIVFDIETVDKWFVAVDAPPNDLVFWYGCFDIIWHDIWFDWIDIIVLELHLLALTARPLFWLAIRFKSYKKNNKLRYCQLYWISLAWKATTNSSINIIIRYEKYVH